MLALAVLLGRLDDRSFWRRRLDEQRRMRLRDCVEASWWQFAGVLRIR